MEMEGKGINTLCWLIKQKRRTAASLFTVMLSGGLRALFRLEMVNDVV